MRDRLDSSAVRGRTCSAQTIRSKWQERHMPGTFDRPRQHALMLGAGSRLSPGTNFTLFRDVSFQQIHVFIVDLFYPLCTELALPPASAKAAARPG
jgi:hypothetical protein